MSCIFCEVVASRVPAQKAYEDDACLAFHDIHPQAPVHVLVVPKRHVTSLLDVSADDDALLGSLVRVARDLAQQLGLAEGGFRLVFNTGADAGYSVFHIHLHLLGGRPLGWPPG
jgi:histidine triad (HIT) family protein